MPPKKVIPEEPLEAQPPAGVVLDDSSVAASNDEMARLMEAATKITYIDEEDDDSDDFPPTPPVAPTPTPDIIPSAGLIVFYVLGRNIIEDLRVKGVPVNTLAMGDCSPAIITRVHEDGTADLRVFVDADAVPVVRRVAQIPNATDVTLDHVDSFFVK